MELKKEILKISLRALNTVNSDISEELREYQRSCYKDGELKDLIKELKVEYNRNKQAIKHITIALEEV